MQSAAWRSIVEDVGGDLGEDRGRVTRARADLEHLVAALELERVGHQGDDVRLRDRLIGIDRQRGVVVGELNEVRRHEFVARHAAHGAHDGRVPYAASRDLPLDHALAPLSWIEAPLSLASQELLPLPNHNSQAVRMPDPGRGRFR